MNKLTTRLATAACAGVVAVATLTTAPAQAAATPYANPATSWLAKRLNKSSLIQTYYSLDGGKTYTSYADYGLSLDVYSAMKASQTQSATAAKILAAVEKNAAAYVTYTDGGTTTFYPGSAGKLAVAVLGSGGNAKNVAGINLISGIEGVTGSDGAASNSYGTVGQSWATRALVDAKSAKAAVSMKYLLAQQCPAGGFRQTIPTGSASCTSNSAAEVDSTAFALQTLVDARNQGTAGLSGAIGKAGTWLASKQGKTGAFSSDGDANANSTGVAALAFAASGDNVRAAGAAGWLVKHQVSRTTGGKLAGHVGAIAYDDAALKAGAASGIPYATRDQWIRATAQAAAAAVVAKKLSMSFSSSSPKRGSTMTVSVTGLSGAEPVKLYVKGKLVKTGTATSNGTFRYSFKVGVLGWSKVSVYGAFVNRSALKTYTAVK